MNKGRRSQLDLAIEKLNEAKKIIEDCYSEEESGRDNLPESLADSEQYQKMDDACNAMEDAIDGIDEVINSLEEAKQ